jgi:hypothetical protein
MAVLEVGVDRDEPSEGGDGVAPGFGGRRSPGMGDGAPSEQAAQRLLLHVQPRLVVRRAAAGYAQVAPVEAQDPGSTRAAGVAEQCLGARPEGGHVRVRPQCRRVVVGLEARGDLVRQVPAQIRQVPAQRPAGIFGVGEEHPGQLGPLHRSAREGEARGERQRLGPQPEGFMDPVPQDRGISEQAEHRGNSLARGLTPPIRTSTDGRYGLCGEARSVCAR